MAVVVTALKYRVILFYISGYVLLSGRLGGRLKNNEKYNDRVISSDSEKSYLSGAIRNNN